MKYFNSTISLILFFNNLFNNNTLFFIIIINSRIYTITAFWPNCAAPQISGANLFPVISSHYWICISFIYKKYCNSNFFPCIMEGMVHLDRLYIYIYFLEDVCFSWIALRHICQSFVSGFERYQMSGALTMTASSLWLLTTAVTKIQNAFD